MCIYLMEIFFNFLLIYVSLISDTVHGEIHNDSSSAVLCPPNITNDENIKGPEPSEFHKWWQQDLTVPLYLLVPFIFVLNLRDAKIFTYFNSLGNLNSLSVGNNLFLVYV